MVHYCQGLSPLRQPWPVQTMDYSCSISVEYEICWQGLFVLVMPRVNSDVG
jgi:hypothetical protein